MRTLIVALTLTLAAVAGCTAPTTDTDADDSAFDPAPTGDGLSAAEVQALAAAFDDEPLTGGQEPWPGHLLKWISEDAFVLMHFDADDPAEASRMLWFGLGVRGVFCAEDQPSEDFTHFHKRTAATYAEGHGGSGGEEGYWLMHLNVRDFESPFGRTGAPGVHGQFGPTPAPACGDAYEPASFDPPGSDGLDAGERAALADALDDEVLRGGQEPWPGHLVKWVSDDTFVLMHFDADDPREASGVLWVGLGVRGEFCQDDQPGEEFVHFHSAHAPEYAAGHGGEPGQPGYWLLHVATHDFESPFGPTGGPGVHHEFANTPAPAC